MAHLQIRNVPDSLHDRLRCFARETNRTLSAAVLASVERELEAWEWRKRLAERSETELGVDATILIAEARALRDRELGAMRFWIEPVGQRELGSTAGKRTSGRTRADRYRVAPVMPRAAGRTSMTAGATAPTS